jgi:hypothetical protein
MGGREEHPKSISGVTTSVTGSSRPSGPKLLRSGRRQKLSETDGEEAAAAGMPGKNSSRSHGVAVA